MIYGYGLRSLQAGSTLESNRIVAEFKHVDLGNKGVSKIDPENKGLSPAFLNKKSAWFERQGLKGVNCWK